MIHERELKSFFLVLRRDLSYHPISYLTFSSPEGGNFRRIYGKSLKMFLGLKNKIKILKKIISEYLII